MGFNIKDMTEWADKSFRPRQEAKVDLDKIRPAVQSNIARMASLGFRFEQATLQAVGAYCAGYSILLSGKVGTGKTHFFELLNPDIVILPMEDIVRQKYDDLLEMLMGYREREILIDDLGTGTANGRDYGQDFDALLTVLNRRNKCLKRTHFTTNLNSDELIKMYDYRAIDRIYGMARPFVLRREESYRKAEATR